MKSFITKIKEIQQTEIKQKIDQRLAEFQQFQTNQKSPEDWFSEFCFCLLTANAKSKTACAIQQELGAYGFATFSHDQLVSVIRRNKHRFHNAKARYILANRKHQDIKEKIVKHKTQQDMREWLVANVRGYGYKEASHFLRNVGFFDLAILDRHVLNHLFENKMINEIPSSLNQKNYLLIEKKMEKLCSLLAMSQGELDMYLWYMKAGDVLK
jgi:N-glycosylase/DNA lyase